MFVTTTEGGMAFAFPDVCLTPPLAIPIPYPNFAFLADGQGSKKVLIRGAQTLRKGDKIVVSTGDEPGCMPGGVVSGVIKGQAVLIQGWSSVTVEGKAVSYLGVMTRQNNSNIVGSVVAVGQTKVKVGSDSGGEGGLEAVAAWALRGAKPLADRDTEPMQKVAPTEAELREAAEFAKRVSASTSRKQADRRRSEQNENNVRARERLTETLNRLLLTGTDPTKLSREEMKRELGRHYDRIPRRDLDALASGQVEPPPVSRERLEDAWIGAPGIGRVPLTFPTREDFVEFRAELSKILAQEGITDATIVQLGSATSGWKGNPGKPIGPWKPTSDADIDIFSPQAIAQARAHGCPINPLLTQHGRFLFFEHHTPMNTGFYDTPLGIRLEALARQWNRRIYGAESPKDGGFKFYLHLHPNWKASRQMTNGIALVQP